MASIEKIEERKLWRIKTEAKRKAMRDTARAARIARKAARAAWQKAHREAAAIKKAAAAAELYLKRHPAPAPAPEPVPVPPPPEEVPPPPEEVPPPPEEVPPPPEGEGEGEAPPPPPPPEGEGEAPPPEEVWVLIALEGQSFELVENGIVRWGYPASDSQTGQAWWYEKSLLRGVYYASGVFFDNQWGESIQKRVELLQR